MRGILKPDLTLSCIAPFLRNYCRVVPGWRVKLLLWHFLITCATQFNLFHREVLFPLCIRITLFQSCFGGEQASQATDCLSVSFSSWCVLTFGAVVCRQSAAGLLLQFVWGGALKSERSMCFPTEFMVSACHSYLVLAFLSGQFPSPHVVFPE